MPAAGKKRLLFVCMGNICRSPTAEKVMRRLLADRGLEDRLEVASASTTRYHAGDPPDPRMRRAAGRRSYQLDGQARQVMPEDFARYDLILAMDRENLDDLAELAAARVDGGGRPARDAGGGSRREDAGSPRRTDGTGSAPRAELRLFGDFLPPGSPRDVPDPYYGGERGFEDVLDLIERACPKIIEHLLKEVARTKEPLAELLN